MSAYPPALKEAAKNQLDNEDFIMLIKYKLNELKDETMDSPDDKEIIRAHMRYTDIREFAEWVQMLGEDRLKGQMG